MKPFRKFAFKYLKIRMQFTAVISPQKAAQIALQLFCTPRRRVAGQRSSGVLSQAEFITSRFNQIKIFGYRWNHPADKRILIAHGFESSAKNFEGYIGPLTDMGYEIIAFDAPGHGASDGNEIHLPLYVEFLQHIAAEYGPFQAYLGHSLGGLAVTHFLETHHASTDTRVVLIAPATETATAVNQFFKLFALNGKVRTAFNRLAVKKNGVPPEHFSVRRAVRHIESPILWLHDTRDEITPFSDAEKVKNDRHPNIRFIVTSGLGHRAIYRNPNTIREVIRFLQ